MTTHIQEHIRQTIAQLDRVKSVLKSEFFGIDESIDHLVQLVTPFIVDPSQFNERPLIINLWGMTGVGKTELINRLLTLTGLKHCSAYFDMGEYQGGAGIYDLRGKLKSLHASSSDNKQTIMVFDEIQHIRTINEKGEEQSNPTGRVLWEIIDKGYTTDREFSDFKQRKIQSYIRRATHAILAGCKAKNNVVVSMTKEFESMGDNWVKKKKSVTHLVPVEQMMDFASQYPQYFRDTIDNSDAIVEMARERMPWSGGEFGDDTLESQLHRNVFCASNHLKNEQTTIEWLTSMIANASPQDIYHFEPLMVIIMGNLDEAYSASGNIGHEASIESIYMSSLGVTLSTIKSALLSRFRAEQIARLGHNHIIYPALNEEAYKQIISTQVSKAESKFKQTYGLTIQYNDSTKELIYYEVVAPAQGARCAITGASALLDSYAPMIALMAQENGTKQSQTIHVDYDEEMEEYTVRTSKWSNAIPIKLQIRTKKSKVNDEKIYSTAVHEAGHAVIHMAVCGEPPKQINCVYSTQSLGSITPKRNTSMSKKQVIDGIAMLLGGREAEIAVYGVENACNGAGSDITTATSEAFVMVSGCGLGKQFKGKTYRHPLAGSYHFNTESAQTELENEVKSILDEASAQAAKIIKDNIHVVMRLANTLVKQKRMNDKEAVRFFAENPVSGQITKPEYFRIFTELLNEIESQSDENIGLETATN